MSKTIPDANFIPAGAATFKRALRKQIKRRFKEHEDNALNITAMLDMMTIILVFLLKSMAASTTSVPQSSDLKLPKSLLMADAAQQGVKVIVTKKAISVEEDELLPVPADGTNGVEARYKRDGANGLYITKLGVALASYRALDRQKKAAAGKPGEGSEAMVIADDETPYRILLEVLATLGENEFPKFHLMAMQGTKK